MPNSDPCQIITPLVLVGLGLGVGEGLGLGVGLGLGNHIAISTRGVIIWQGVKNGHNTGFTDEMCMTISPSPTSHSFSLCLSNSPYILFCWGFVVTYTINCSLI